MNRYTRNGEHVLDGDTPIAHARDEVWAMSICNALNAMQERCEVQDQLFANALATIHMRRHEGDEMACSCGLRWDVRDADPH